ncbi:MAG TPA: hypothetical protein VG649_17175 [Candidatus Angelobacter sp.]|nr:hypothetical protein [Candidatus Angelobacter sp.]
MTNASGDISATIRSVTSQLQDLDRDLKSQQLTDLPLIQAFRDALDRSRTTAWTMTEVLHARQINKNPDAALPFLFAERIRRFTQMTKDLSADLEQDITPNAITALSDALELLQSKLKRMANKVK